MYQKSFKKTVSFYESDKNVGLYFNDLVPNSNQIVTI